MLKNLVFLNPVLDLFAALNLNVTTDSGMGNDLSAEQKVYFEKELLRELKGNLPHAEFGQKKVIPEGHGNSIEWRKMSPLPKALVALTEGVAPEGNNLDVTKVTGELHQYGAFVAMSDLLISESIDPMLMEAHELLASQAARTIDTICREVIVGGTNVIYAGDATDRANLAGGDATGKVNCYLTVKKIQEAVAFLKVQHAPTFGKDYMGIIHPYVAYDLKQDPRWEYPHQYKDTAEIYDGELGRIEHVRFVESAEAKVFTKAGTNWATGDAVPSDRDVYVTMIIGKNAYGVVTLEKNSLEYIFKPKDSGGVSNPLNQYATSGWKTTTACVRLMETNMVRIESCSALGAEA